MSGYSASVFTRSDDIGNFLINTNEAPLKLMEFPERSLNLPGDRFGIFVPARYRLASKGSIDLPIIAHSKKHASANDAQWMNAQLIPDKYIHDNSSIAGDNDHRDISFAAPKVIPKRGFVLKGNSKMFAQFYNVNADGTSKYPSEVPQSENRKKLLDVYKNQLKNADDLQAMGRNIEAAEAADRANEFLLVEDPVLFSSVMAGRNMHAAPVEPPVAPNIPMDGAEPIVEDNRENPAQFRDLYEEQLRKMEAEEKMQIRGDREMAERFQNMYDSLPDTQFPPEIKAEVLSFILNDMAGLTLDEKKNVKATFQYIIEQGQKHEDIDDAAVDFIYAMMDKSEPAPRAAAEALGSPVKPVDRRFRLVDSDININIFDTLKEKKADPIDILEAISINGLEYSDDVKEVDDKLAIITNALKEIKGDSEKPKKRALMSLQFVLLINNAEGVINFDDIATVMKSKNLANIVRTYALIRDILGPEQTTSGVALQLARIPKGNVSFKQYKSNLVKIMQDKGMPLSEKNQEIGRLTMNFVDEHTS
jgi:hypothetical protein